MALNLCQIVTKAAGRWHDPGYNVILQDTWCDYINEAMRVIQQETPFWPWNESSRQAINISAAGGYVYDMPGDSYTINWAYNVTCDTKMYPDEGRGSQWHASRQQIDTTGIPTTYKVRGAPGTGEAGAGASHGCVEFYPAPDSSYCIDVEVTMYNPVLDATVNCIPPFPSIFHSILVDGALAFASQDDDDIPGYNVRMASFCSSIKGLEWNMLAARNETNAPIRDSFWL